MSAQCLRPTSAAHPPAVELGDRLDGCHVLVVDDDEDTLGLLATVLRMAGATVAAVPSPGEALARLDDGPPPEAIVVDIAMPGTDGYELLAAVRQRPAGRGGAVPAMAITAGAFDLERGRGFLSWLQKPLDPPELVSAVRAIVTPCRRRRPAACPTRVQIAQAVPPPECASAAEYCRR